ncbi:MAG: Lrp/AsnC family transcriptional regulator [Nocardioides sp.]
MMLDSLDVALLSALTDSPRAGQLELARRLEVARATVQARIRRLEEAGVITGYGPDVDLDAAGQSVSAFVSLQIAQGALEELRPALEAIPYVVEAYATTGDGDVLCRVAAPSHRGLQQALLQLDQTPLVVRSTSVVVLSTVVAPRVLPLLAQSASGVPRAPGYRPSPRP